MHSRAVASLAVASLVTAACGPSWPGRATALIDPKVPPGAVRTIDVLPADLQLWAGDTQAADPEELRQHAEVALMQTTARTLSGRGQAVNLLDWGGFANGAPVMDPHALDMTETSLSGYGAMADASPHTLPVPYLPARLGAYTNADATLYIGGWAFVGEKGSSTGEKIAEGVLIALAIVAVVVVVAAIAGGHGGGGHGGGGGGGGHGGGGGGGFHGGGGAAGGALRGTSGVLSKGGASAMRGGSRASSLLNGTGRVHVPTGGSESYNARRRSEGVADDIADIADIADDSADAFGHLVQIPVRPDYAVNGPSSGESQMYLEMTLVDNRTGMPIWHARQWFPAGADSASEVDRAARVMLASLPR